LITKVDANSLAEQSGLRAGDTVLEINGTKTNGLTNKSIANLITSAGNEITFLVGRKRLTPAQIGFVDDAAIRESALRITRDTIAEAKSRVQQQQQEQPDEYQSGSQSGSPAIGQRHVSRRDSQNQSPKLLREEIKLSSSKLYGAYPDTHSTSSLSQSPPLTTNSYQQQPAPQVYNNFKDFYEFKYLLNF
jgi:membrane-associated protease RseP (regulator of RpoE activity)